MLGVSNCFDTRRPIASIITPYNSGFKGWSPMLQWMFNF
jgi:hypothetical protein